MMKIIVVVVLTAAAVVAKPYSQCPTDKKPMTSFDRNKFSGLWYAIASNMETTLPQVNVIPTKCSQVIISADTEFFELVDAIYLSRVDELVTLKSTSLLPYNNSSEIRIASRPNSGFKRVYSTFTVMDTDYENYAATYVCGSMAGSLYRIEITSILSRRPTLDEKFVSRLEEVLASNNLKKFEYMNPEIQDCGEFTCDETLDNCFFSTE